MPFTGWAELAGVELVNNQRAAGYAAGRIPVDCLCADLAGAVGDLPSEVPPDDADYRNAYTTPEGNEARGEDPAPWFDESVPESKDLFGFVGLEFDGADGGTGERQWTENLSDGGVGGALRRGSREVEFSVQLLAGSEAALSYGKAWLASALRGSACAPGCSGDQLCVLAYCPQVPADVDPEDYATTAWDLGTDALRTMFNVSLLEGPTLEEQTRVQGGFVAEVSFVLKAGWPWWYHSPVPVASGDGQSEQWQTVPGYDPVQLARVCDELDQDAVNCLADNPFCSGANRPWEPEDPPIPPDPCFPTSSYTLRRAIVPVPADALPSWFEKVPVVTVATGAFAMRRFTLRWHDNVRGDACTLQGGEGDMRALYEQQCQACAEVQIPWIPANSTLTIDGRTQRAEIECPGQNGGVVEPTLYGKRGLLFRWPTFDCGTGMCMEISADSVSFATDMSFQVDMVARGDAA